MDAEILNDLRELKKQLATVLDDEVILGVFDRAVTEIEQMRHQLAEDYLASKAEIERLRSEVDECRRLLREGVNRLESDPVWWVHSLACEYWCEQAAKAAGGEG